MRIWPLWMEPARLFAVITIFEIESSLGILSLIVLDRQNFLPSTCRFLIKWFVHTDCDSFWRGELLELWRHALNDCHCQHIDFCHMSSHWRFMVFQQNLSQQQISAPPSMKSDITFSKHNKNGRWHICLTTKDRFVINNSQKFLYDPFSC